MAKHDVFGFVAYRGWQPVDIVETTIAAIHLGDGWDSTALDRRLIQRRVYAGCACEAIGRFQQWQREGLGDSWLLNMPVGQRNYEYTVCLIVQPGDGTS